MLLRTAIFPLFFILLRKAETFNILVVTPHPGRSQFECFVVFFRELAQRGHNVSVISHFPQKENIPNYRDIDLGKPESREKNISSLDSKALQYFLPLILGEIGTIECERLYSSKAVQSFLNESNHFDLALISHFNTNCFLTLAKKFNIPVIRTLSYGLLPWSDYRYANPNNPSYIPNIFLPFSDRMQFLERIENTLLVAFHNVYFNWLVFAKKDKEVSVRYFGELGDSMYEDMLNDSLLLFNNHYSVNYPRPLVPNIIPVGGIHIQKPVALRKDIEKWINESKHGVIYFSFGSLVKGHTMPAEKRQAFINAFKRLPQRVIWKWENETMEGKTDNILIGKWMPQFDILSHPNVKAFISHGGLLGTFEAVHCGVPVLVMPQFGDQHTNAKAIESVGGGEILYLSDATEEKIYTALKKILSPSFQEQAKELSERFRDRPMSPLDTAIYWVEYVARHKGAHFMKTAAVGMPFYQYYLLDVIGFILAVLIIFLYVSYLILRFLFRLVFKPKHSSSKKVKKS